MLNGLQSVADGLDSLTEVVGSIFIDIVILFGIGWCLTLMWRWLRNGFGPWLVARKHQLVEWLDAEDARHDTRV